MLDYQRNVCVGMVCRVMHTRQSLARYVVHHMIQSTYAIRDGLDSFVYIVVCWVAHVYIIG